MQTHKGRSGNNVRKVQHTESRTYVPVHKMHRLRFSSQQTQLELKRRLRQEFERVKIPPKITQFPSFSSVIAVTLGSFPGPQMSCSQKLDPAALLSSFACKEKTLIPYRSYRIGLLSQISSGKASGPADRRGPGRDAFHLLTAGSLPVALFQCTEA